MATYDSLHRQCRTLESLFDSKLTSYARMGSSISRNEDLEAVGSSERWQDVETELEDLLEKVRRPTNSVTFRCSKLTSYGRQTRP